MKTEDMLTARDIEIDVGGGPGDAAGRPSHDADWAFGLAAPELQIFTTGLRQRLTPGPAATLGARVDDFFGRLLPTEDDRTPQPRLLVGALPFDREAEDFLFLPQRAANRPWPFMDRTAAQTLCAQVTAEPDRDAYQAAVVRALSMMSAGERPLKKVVLSRSLRIEADRAIDPFTLWLRLRADPSAVRFVTPVGAGPGGAVRRLVGASPELLVSKVGDAVLSHPLAGSSRRHVEPALDEGAARALKTSDKDRREHALVVEAILDSLAPYCRELNAPSDPALVSTRTMWHLGTRIEGRLRRPGEVNAAELAAALHPTPAVAGTPRDRAITAIRDLEGYDRGFYAGAFGWTNAAGDGAWYVALRCAEVCGRQARLYAGAGVVQGSDPRSEADETSAKFQAMLRALGIDEAGRPLPGEKTRP